MTQIHSLLCTLLLACPALHAEEQKELPAQEELMKLIVIYHQATIKAMYARVENPEARKLRVVETYILEELEKLERSKLSPATKRFIPFYQKNLSSTGKKRDPEFRIFTRLISASYDGVLFKVSHLTPMYEVSKAASKARRVKIQTLLAKELELLHEPEVLDFVLRFAQSASRHLSLPDSFDDAPYSEEEGKNHKKLQREYILKASRAIADELRPYLTTLPAPLAQGFKQYFDRVSQGEALFELSKKNRGKLDDNELMAIYLAQDALNASILLKSEKNGREHR